jgi:hypothetical protein
VVAVSFVLFHNVIEWLEGNQESTTTR